MTGRVPVRALLGLGVAALLTAVAVAAAGGPRAAGAQAGAELRSPDAFASIGDTAQRSVALFVEAGKVLQHPRCRNCHPQGDRPTQGDDGRPHLPVVRRGDDGHGAPGLRCEACHQAANYDAVGMPGQKDWHLAPRSMALQGRSLPEICAQLKDQDKNGVRTLAQIVDHVTTDPLVLWTWAPGPGRRPAPGTPAVFAALIKAWADSGADCPRG
jgi:hypothetical protein